MKREPYFDLCREAPASTRLGSRNPSSTPVLAPPRPVAWRDRAAASARITRRAPGADAGLAAGGVRQGGVGTRGARTAERDR